MKTTLLNIFNDKQLMFNGITLSISFTNVEMVLKIMLLTISIVLSTMKVIEMLKKKKEDE